MATAPAETTQATPVSIRSGVVRLRETDRFRAPAFNHTIAPRDAEVVRYRFDVPASLDPGRIWLSGWGALSSNRQ